jgi:hypothetical protein
MNAVLARGHPARVAATAFSTETGISCCSSTWLGEVVRVFGCVLPFALSWQPLDIHDTPFARPRAFVVSPCVLVDVRQRPGKCWWRCLVLAPPLLARCVCWLLWLWCVVPRAAGVAVDVPSFVLGAWHLAAVPCRRQGRQCWQCFLFLKVFFLSFVTSFVAVFFCPLFIIKKKPGVGCRRRRRTTEQKALTITRASNFVVRWRSVFRRHVGTFRRVQEHHPLPMYRHIDRATSDVQAHRPSYFRCTGTRATFRRCTGSYFDVAFGTGLESARASAKHLTRGKVERA